MIYYKILSAKTSTHMLLDDELLEGKVSNGLLIHMKNILDEEIQEGERLFQERYADTGYYRERIRFRDALIRKKFC